MRNSFNTQRDARPAEAHRSNARVPEPSPAPPTQLNLDLGNWTPTPNLFFKWVNKLDLVEVRIVALLVRSTFGWRRERCRFSVDEITQQVNRSKPPVIDALARLRNKGILGRSRTSRQESYEYWLVMRPEFRVVKRRAAPEHIQMQLGYDVHDFSSKETFTTGEVKKPLPLSSKETFTTEPPVLIVDLRKERSINTHTPPTRPSPPVEKTKPAAAPRVCGSRFTKSDLKRYAQQVGWIDNPTGWANAALKNGQFDDDVQEYIEDLESAAKREARQAEERLGDCDVFETACIAVELTMNVENLSLAEAITRLREASRRPDVIPERDVWEALLQEIKTKLNSDSFEAWFKPLRFEGLDRALDIFRVEAPNQVVKDWIRVNYADLVAESLNNVGLAGYSIEWTISGVLVNPLLQNVGEALIQRVIGYFARGSEAEAQREAEAMERPALEDERRREGAEGWALKFLTRFSRSISIEATGTAQENHNFD